MQEQPKENEESKEEERDPRYTLVTKEGMVVDGIWATLRPEKPTSPPAEHEPSQGSETRSRRSDDAS